MAVGITILDKWKNLIDRFFWHTFNPLMEVRTEKLNIEQLRQELLNEIHKGQYIRDDECIVISAPKIIIGNVAKDGTLLGDSGEIILRGQKLTMAGVGESGSLTMTAPVIEQKAIDTGIDGLERVVYNTSKVHTQASSIFLNSQSPIIDKKEKGTFMPSSAGNGITLSSEKGIEVLATPQNTKKKTAAETEETSLGTQITSLKSKIRTRERNLNTEIGRLTDILNDAQDLNLDDDLTRTNVLAIDELAVALKEELPVFNNSMLEYLTMVSELAELNRQKKTMEAEKKHADAEATKTAYQKSTGASITLQSEQINLYSMDGDGAWRTSDYAGVDIQANDIKLRSIEKDEALTPKGSVAIQSRQVTITTMDTQLEKDGSNNITKIKGPAVGDVTIQSKTINMKAVDVEADSNGEKETALTKGGAINMRAEKVDVSATDTDGKATGSIAINAKDVQLKAMDVVKKDGKDDKTADNGSVSLAAETMRLGYPSAPIKDSQMAKNMFISTKETLSISPNKNVIIRSKDSSIEMSDRIELKTTKNFTIETGEGTTINGKDTTINTKLKGKDIDADNITAKTSLTGPKTQDGTKLSVSLPAGSVNIPAPPEDKQTQDPQEEDSQINQKQDSFLECLWYLL